MSKGNSLGFDLKRNPVINSIGNNHTKQQYQKDLKKFNNYCKEYGMNKLDKIKDPVATIQEYADYLKNKGHSPQTIHTYLAPACRAFKVDMGDIRKPKRHSANTTRSRGNKNPQGQREAAKKENQRLIDFCKCVGIRRAECKRLTGKNLKEVNGNLYVEVEKGYPTTYDRLPLLAFSVLVLSHYRNDVTISNYMLT